MAHLWHRRDGESKQALQPLTTALESNPNWLHFSISHGDPLHMSFTQQGGDLAYKAETSSHVSTITCKTGDQSKEVAKIHWHHYDIGTIMLEFTGQEAMHLEDFLKFAKEVGL